MAENIPTAKIIRHAANPRDDMGDLDALGESITVHGLQDPLIVFEHPRKPGYYVLLDGERRWRAANDAGVSALRCEVRTAPRTTAEAIIFMLVSTWQRKDLNPIEKARGLGELRRRGATIRQIAAAMGITGQTVSYHLALLDLDEESQQRVIDKTVTAGDAHRAVTGARQASRRRSGGARAGRPAVRLEPRSFTGRHPLARQVAATCNHANRHQLGKVGCEQCWEQAIRADERNAGGRPLRVVGKGA